VVIVRKSPVHGKGVFTTTEIKKNTILTCDVIEVPKGRTIDNYVFPYIGTRVCIHLGFGSFFNSSLNPNIKHLKIDVESNVSYFEVLRDISLGEELFLSYGTFE